MEKAGDAAFPWGLLMAFGLAHLRLSPETFWRMSLPEILATARWCLPAGLKPQDRAGLQALMARFPDAAERPGAHNNEESDDAGH